jgi:hypothetical protein
MSHAVSLTVKSTRFFLMLWVLDVTFRPGGRHSMTATARKRKSVVAAVVLALVFEAGMQAAPISYTATAGTSWSRHQ